MDRKFTHGPWEVSKIANNYNHYMVYAEASGANVVNTVYGKANAHLIAATPDLLEALQLYLTDCDVERLEYNDDTYTLARQAIAKATQGD